MIFVCAGLASDEFDLAGAEEHPVGAWQGGRVREWIV